MELNKLTTAQSEGLVRDFSEEEVRFAIDELAQEKISAPDGFPIAVCKKGWFFMKDDVMRVVRELQDKNFISWRLNNSSIVLMLKKEGEKQLMIQTDQSLVWGL